MQPELILTPFANSATPGTIEPIPEASSPGDLPQKATWEKGFPSVTMTPLAAGGIPPQGQDFNGVLNAISEHTVYSGAGGQYAWSAEYVAKNDGYPKGALVARNDYSGYWQNIVDNNTTNPDAGGSGWIPLNGQGGDYALDTGTANTYIVAYSPAISTIVDGMTLKLKAKTANTGASTFSPNGLGAKPIIGSAHAALQGGEIVTNGDVWLQYNSSIGAGSWVLIDSTGGALQIAPAMQSQHAVQFSQVSGVVSSMRNLGCSVPIASAIATVNADEIVVESALGGLRYCLPNFSKTINLATTGIGGMDTGAAPTNGFVGIYAIYNPTTGASALLAVNATGAKAAEVYGGANMPSGYIASALIGVYPTNANRQFAIFYQVDRDIYFSSTTVISVVTPVANMTAVSIASIIPKNAKTIRGWASINSTSAANSTVNVAGSVSNIGLQQVAATTQSSPATITGSYSGVPLITPQTVFWSASMASGTFNAASLNISGYSF